MTISGIVEGAPDAGTTWDGSYRLEYSPMARFAGEDYSTIRDTDVTLKDGKGEFLIEDLWPGTVKSSAGKNDCA